MPGLVGQMLDQYRLVEQVGQGGMATVYRALDTRTLREVALKVLSPTIVGDKRFVRRFRREATLVTRLKHPNILPVLGYGESRGFVYIVMPFIKGLTLHDYMNKRRLTDAESARWIGQVLAALDFAHRHGVIHRDVKPSNIMIDENGDALLTDFGLARMTEGTGTLTGSMLMGTPAYVSPEQGRGSRIDGRSDEYSLGIILYQIATGVLPFEGNSPMATVLMHLQEAAIRPRRLNPDLSPLVEAVILKTLEKDPVRRFPSVAALGRAYMAALAGTPPPGVELLPSPPPDGSTLPLERPIVYDRGAMAGPSRRRLGWPITLGVLAVLLILGIVFYPKLSDMLTGVGTTPSGTLGLPTPASTQSALVPLSTATTAPTATATPVTAAGCEGIRLFFGREGSDVFWTVDNGRGEDIRLLNVNPGGPDDNLPVAIWYGGEALWESPGRVPPDPATAITIPADERTVLASGATKQLLLSFAVRGEEPGYSLEILFGFSGSTCTLTTTW